MSRQRIDVATEEDTSSKLQRLKLMSRREIDVAIWMMSRQGTRGRDLNSNMGQSTWKSTKECIRIRAQQRNPINKQLPRSKRQVEGKAERKIWVAEGFTLFFFSFLFFIFFFCFRRYRLDYFDLSLFIFFIFWIWMLSF